MDGAVKTDLSNLSSSERETYADEIGEEALDAALRIRDRIVDSPTAGGALDLPLPPVLRAGRDPA